MASQVWKKCFKAWNTASISRQLMCHMRWGPSHRPWAEQSLMTAPQPVREASVVSVTRRHRAPNTGPCDRNHSFFHMSKAHKHRRLTLIMRNWLPLWENPVVLSPHCKGLMCSRPKVITVDAAAIRPNSFWKSFKVRDWPPLTLLTAARIESIRAGDRRACTLLYAFSLNLKSFMWARMISRCPTANCSDWARINQSSM